MKRRATVKFTDLRDAFDYVSFGAPMENTAYLCIRTGTFHWHSEFGDNQEELPADIDDASAYISIPHKYDLDLGKRLALQFASEQIPELFGHVQDIFSRRGAYARFKDLLEHREIVQQWYAYEEEATVAALRGWCADNGIEKRIRLDCESEANHNLNRLLDKPGTEATHAMKISF